MFPLQSDLRNRLLLALPDNEYALVAPHLEALDLPREFVIAGPGAEIDHVYFFETGICSIVAKSPEGNQAEAGIFGRESFGPSVLVHGVTTNVLDTYVQVPGEGHRIATGTFLELLDSCPNLKQVAQFGAYLLGLQTTYTSLSNAVHQVDERLARWLLMCHDRTDGDEIALTHEFIALMLAVRRPSVTTALHTLEGRRLIRAERGQITIRDREGLEAFAADAYGTPEREYLRLLGPMR
jgi:CRP-like cAMP-binding protein